MSEWLRTWSRKVIGISIFSIVFLCGVHGSCSGQEAPLVGSEVADFQKLEPALKFLRARNARTYAITAPNGIDEATYVKIGGIEQWIAIRGEDRNNPVLLFLHGGPGDATNALGVRSVSQLAEVFHRCAMGPARRRENVRTKRNLLCVPDYTGPSAREREGLTPPRSKLGRAGRRDVVRDELI